MRMVSHPVDSDSPWTIESLLIHFSTRLDHLANDVNLAREQEHLYHQEVDRRYQQRFDQQQHAVALALSAVDKEFHEHIIQVREETNAALTAADRAITKSEAASEKRFESVNEFRGQLSDQSKTFISRVESISRHERTSEQIEALSVSLNEFRNRIADTSGALMPRAEAEQRINAVTEKTIALESRLLEALSEVNSRLDRTAGAQSGSARIQATIFAVVGAFVGIAGIVAAVIANAS